MASLELYETARTRELLKQELSNLEREFVLNVERSGCQILTVDAALRAHCWSYTFGLFDTCARPELVVIGLSSTTAGAALDFAIDLIRSGVDLSRGRHRKILGEVEVEFRAADPEWVKELMGSARWFYGRREFPVLQMIYPDLEDRFQWEDGFNEYFRQPLLQAGATQTETEDDFRKSLDPESSFYDWAFPDPPHTQSYLSTSVHDGDEVVTYISHDSDGDWQFLGDRMADGGGPVLSCLHHPVDRDASLKEIADLPRGWYAEREAVGKAWSRHKLEAETET